MWSYEITGPRDSQGRRAGSVERAVCWSAWGRRLLDSMAIDGAVSVWRTSLMAESPSFAGGRGDRAIPASDVTNICFKLTAHGLHNTVVRG